MQTMLSGLVRSVRGSSPRRGGRARRPSLEGLERRALLTLYRFTTIADSASPQFSVFDNVSGPALNDGGQVAFQAIQDVGGSGIFVGDGSVMTTVAAVGLTYKIFGDPAAINNAGTVAFPAFTKPTGMGQFSVRSGVTTTVGNNAGPLNTFAAPAINEAGALAYTATLDAGGQGLYLATGGAPTQLATTGAGVNALTVGRHGINATNGVAYRADLAGGAGRISLYAGGATTTVAATGATYMSFGDPGVDDAGDVIFQASLAAGGSGIYSARGGVITPIVTSGPSFAVFGTAPAINARGGVAFYASSPVSGIGIFTGPDPVADKVIAVGSPLAGSTVQSLVFSGAGLNNNGQLAFYATLADGRKVIVRADPLNGPAVSVGSATGVEADGGQTGTVSFPVTLSQASAQATVVSYATANGTAIGGVDYQATTGSITIPAGQTTGTISVLTYGNNLVQPDRTFALNLTGVSAPATILNGSATGTTRDNDTIYVSVANATVFVTEVNGTQTLNLPVVLTKAIGNDVTVSYATANGTARAGSDYTAKSGTLTIPAGATSGVIAITILGDLLNESNEAFTVTISNALGALLGTSRSTVTIVNDDPMPAVSIGDVTASEGNSGGKTFTFTVSLSAASGQTAYISYATANGTAAAGSDYTAKSGTLVFSPGQTSKTVFVTVAGDTVVEGNERFTVNLRSPSRLTIARGVGIGTIVNDDGALKLAAADAGTGSPGRLGDAQLAPIVAEAIARWWRVGADAAALGAVSVRVADLPGRQLGQAGDGVIVIDADAGGRGWFVDATPADDREFAGGRGRGPAARGVDLLSVVAHELGHVLGLGHSDVMGDVMDDSLPVGWRRTPTASDPGGEIAPAVAPPGVAPAGPAAAPRAAAERALIAAPAPVRPLARNFRRIHNLRIGHGSLAAAARRPNVG